MKQKPSSRRRRSSTKSVLRLPSGLQLCEMFFRNCVSARIITLSALFPRSRCGACLNSLYLRWESRGPCHCRQRQNGWAPRQFIPLIRWPLSSSLPLERSFQSEQKVSSMQSARRLRRLRPIMPLVKRLHLGWSAKVFQHRKPERSFQSFASAHATAGGTNEQFLKHLVEHGLLTSVSEGLDAVLHRIVVKS